MAYSILIVDDEDIIRKGLEHVVSWETLGYTVVGAVASGEEALRFLENGPVDVILADIRMPRLSGIELARLVKLHYQETLVVILSGYDNFSYAQNAIRYGVYHYLLKPCAEEEIIEVFTCLHKEIEKIKERRISFTKMNRIILHEELANLIAGKIPQEETSELQAWKQHYRNAKVGVLLLQLVPDEEIFQSTLANQDFTNPIFSLPLYDSFDSLLDCDGLLAVKLPQERLLCLLPFEGDFVESDIARLFVKLRTLLHKEMPLDVMGLYRVLAAGDSWFDSELKNLVVQADHLFWSSESGVLESVSPDHLETHGKAYVLPVPTTLAKELCSRKKSGSVQDDAASIDSVPLAETDNPVVWMQDYLAVLKGAIELGGADSSSITTVGDAVLPLVRCCSTRSRILQLASSLGKFACQMITSHKDRCYSKNIRDALQLIEQRYQSNVNLEELSRELGLTSTYLSKLFKREVGVKFKEYLLEKQISEAKRMLRETNDKIYEIAEAVGYSDQHYFSDVFKRCTTLTPLEYRKVAPNA
ncbi:MAG: response regulator [Sphaerochaeta sp.]|nr:response regulator [Sphaerochaeta sp.]